MSTLMGVQRELLKTWMDELKGLQTMKKVSADGLEIVRELQLEEPKYVTELLHSGEKTVTVRLLPLNGKTKKVETHSC